MFRERVCSCQATVSTNNWPDRGLHLLSKGLDPTELWEKEPGIWETQGVGFISSLSALHPPQSKAPRKRRRPTDLPWDKHQALPRGSMLTLGPKPDWPWGWTARGSLPSGTWMGVGRKEWVQIRQWFPAISPEGCLLIAPPPHPQTQHLKDLSH